MAAVQSTSTASDIYSKLNSAGKTKTTSEAMQDRFLTLLVKQMQTQDPLNPMDNAQFTSQMAQINTVTGLEKLNVSMAAMTEAYNAQQTMQAASMIGRTVLGKGSNLSLNSGAAYGAVDVPASATKLGVSIYDSKGVLVREMSYGTQPAGVMNVLWDGKDTNGQAVADGEYRFIAHAVVDTKETSLSTLSFSRVNSVLVTSDGVKVSLANGQLSGLSDIKQIM